MFEIKSFIDGYEVVGSGVLHLGVPRCKIVFDGMPIEMEFKNDLGAVRYDMRVEGRTLYFDLYNFKNSLGEGRVEPIVIAQAQGRSVLFSFYVETLGGQGDVRVMSYSFLLGANENG
ncbi:hypothetical protein E8F20_27630 [Pseudomonas sp. BN415]|uniref:DUF6864 domain-containing function n=1 Tax=Pseudomonas sp. BN415 TaxID=2567889 RepID=UPI00245692EA|nr:hypothetical protein [Pseudomonas sp. BN415]MDH4585623.1 hypothetical protein [Pseudomonas sp. BN415]